MLVRIKQLIFLNRAAIHHPDKAKSPADHSEAEEYFVKLKSAQDTLTNPTKRFAYERFGPDILQWQHVSSIRDYLSVGFQGLIPLYGGSVAFMMLLSMMGYLQSGRYVSDYHVGLNSGADRYSSTTAVALPDFLWSSCSGGLYTHAPVPSTNTV